VFVGSGFRHDAAQWTFGQHWANVFESNANDWEYRRNSLRNALTST
jgi:hypothetical protein